MKIQDARKLALDIHDEAEHRRLYPGWQKFIDKKGKNKDELELYDLWLKTGKDPFEIRELLEKTGWL